MEVQQPVDKLPNTAHELIDVALRDLEAAEASPNYEIDMGEWHTPEDDVCLVCLGGAVLAGTLETPQDFVGIPNLDMITDDDCSKVMALDHLRSGFISNFIRCKDQDDPAEWHDSIEREALASARPHRRYNQDSEHFKAWLRDIRDFFKARDL